MHKKSFNVDVDDYVSEKFSAQVEERGYIKYRAIEGALCAFMALSPDIQVKIMSDTGENIAELLQSPQPLPDDQIEKLWTQMEKIAEKIGVKINKPKRKRG